jgi:predicted nucleotidyltransferase
VSATAPGRFASKSNPAALGLRYSIVGEGNAEAERVLAGAVDAYRAALGKRLLAAYALGSLAHGGFSPLVSDIDLGLIVEDPIRVGDAETIEAMASAEKAKPAALADRLSVFWATPLILRGDDLAGRFPPLDRLDLLENGRLLSGTDVRTDLPRPTTGQLLVAGAEFALDFLAGIPQSARGAGDVLGSMRHVDTDAVQEIRSPETLLAHGVRRTTKVVLFPVRFLFTAATGLVGTNGAAVTWYLADATRPSTALVAAALAWRTDPPTDDDAAKALLHEQMMPLYTHYIDDHIARLTALPAIDLARAFEDWHDRLVR